MATKKLKVEVELETAKARRKAKQDLENLGDSSGAGGGGGASSSADKLAKSLERASRSADKSASSFEGLHGTAGRLTRGFAGIAVGMATSYAAKYAQGQTKVGLEYAGSGIQGAVGGAMMAGLPGAIVGGLAGVLKTYMERDAHQSAVAKDFKVAEDTYENNRLWQKKIRDLSDVDYSPVNLKGTALTQDKISKTDDRLEQVKAVAVGLFDEQNKLVARINDLLKKGETEEAEKLQKDLAIVRAKKEQAESLEQSYARQKKSLEHQLAQEKYDEEHKKEKNTGGRAYYSGTDALAKVGGGVGVPSAAQSRNRSSAEPLNRRRQETVSVPVEQPKERRRQELVSVPVEQPEKSSKSDRRTFHDIGGDFFLGGAARPRGVDTTFFTQPDTSVTKMVDELIARKQQEGNELLKQIVENTKRNGASTWL